MALTSNYAKLEPPRSEIDALAGPAILEFGTPWCGHCNAAQPLLASALADQPLVTHVKIEDGKGRPLGRSFRVKLWPTLIFLRNSRTTDSLRHGRMGEILALWCRAGAACALLRDGKGIARLVRPVDGASVREAVAQIG